MRTEWASRGWKSGLVFVGVLSMATGCGVDQPAPAVEGVDDNVAALTNGSVVAFEAETLTRSASAIGSKVTSEGAANAGKYVEFNGTASQSGSWIEFVLPNIAAGPYSLSFLYKANSNRGIVQASIDGVDQGSSCDEYRSTSAFQVSCALGDKSLSAGNHNIRFRVTGKGASSSGYQMVVDKISLTFKGQCTALADCAAGYMACVSNKCVCRQKSASNLVQNANFDGSLTPWQTFQGSTVYVSSDDADGCPGSGSVSTPFPSAIGQCLPVKANTRYYFGVRYHNSGYCYLAFYTGASCDSATSVGSTLDLLDGAGFPTWTSMSSFAVSPTGSVAARVVCSSAVGSGPYDQLYLNPVTNSY